MQGGTAATAADEVRQDNRKRVAQDGRQGEGGSSGGVLGVVLYGPATRRVRPAKAVTPGAVRKPMTWTDWYHSPLDRASGPLAGRRICR